MKARKIHPMICVPADRVFPIRDFAQMDIQATDPNECGVFTDAVYVNIPVRYGYACVLGMAKSRQGAYHISYHLATSTGCNTCGVSASKGTFGSQEDAFVGGLEYIKRLFKVDGLWRYIAEAKREFFKHHHKQLSLFD